MPRVVEGDHIYIYIYIYILENESHKVLWDFLIKKDHLISAGRPDRFIINKKENFSNSGLCNSCRPQGKTERKRKET